LAWAEAPGDFAGKVAQLLTELEHRAPEPATASDADCPKVWLLGSGTRSAELATEFGTAYCHAHFLNPASGREALATYGECHRPLAQAAVAVRVYVADTEAKAADLATGFLLWRSRKDLGDDRPVPSPETVRRHRWTGAETARAQAHRAAVLFGAPEQVAVGLRRLAAEHGVAELVVNTIAHDPADRRRSYELLSREFELPAIRGDSMVGSATNSPPAREGARAADIGFDVAAIPVASACLRVNRPH
jgi:alkanesulfonate monooxygenase SsuD/methylene tetrahydromethanopterin reductase-like flavin-dependent oxidoreductase (luciferase family)